MSRLLACGLLLAGCVAGRGPKASGPGNAPPPVAVSTGAAASPPLGPLERLSKRIDGLIADGKFFRAMELTRQLLALFPNDPGGLALRGRIDKGIEEASKAGGARASYAAGHRAYFAGRWEEAVESLSDAAAKEPADDEVREYLNEASRRREDLKELERIKTAARISYLYDLAHTAYSSGDGDKALKILDEILKISSYSPAVRLEMEIVDEQGGVRSDAPSDARGSQKALDLYFRAVRKYGEGDLPGAIELLRDAQVLDPESLDIRSTLERAEQEWNASKTGP